MNRGRDGINRGECLLLGRKVMTNLDSILKNRDTTLLTKVCLVKAMVFPVIMYGCESWTITKPECRRIDAFELWCWRKFLRVPWIARRSNQSSWIVIGRTDAEVETLILWSPDVKNWLIWKDPDAGKDWRQEKGTTEDEMVRWHHQLVGREFEQAPELDKEAWHAAVDGGAKSQTGLSDWTELRYMYMLNWITLPYTLN